MTASHVRNALLRTLFDRDFHDQMLADPKQALAEYDLTDEERKALVNPSQDLYRFLTPSHDVGLLSPDGGTPPPPPTTITVIIVVAIIVTAVVSPRDLGASIHVEKLQPLLDAIRSTKGQARFDLIRTLTIELTKGS